ncbi:hypothetical protein HPB48_003792 [Haemaphysalis longicornis]|uniref:Uncharacterized protein n=1 Tax=Haemaphysalis longicornis TaxID=44386 RepID=A0A9J6FGG7_HAELO|nr:hypothetical protein HPB48_003792 [Haemaphysalis longicornis]
MQVDKTFDQDTDADLNSYHQPPLPPLPYPLPSHVDNHLQKKSPSGRGLCQRGKSLQKSGERIRQLNTILAILAMPPSL